MAYKTTWRVSFGEIDYAGIVYYPNFFDYFQRTEEVFMEHIGFPYPYLIGELKIGFPIVRVEADFKNPVRYGDAFDVSMNVARLGNSSVTFSFRVFKGQQLCGAASITHATIDMKTFKSIPIPAELRALFEKHLQPSSQ
ncbi:acyl-CoA thioesterase [Candidatus Acetothermia bacterium]|jgi:YbgC/YbaW family acyl-CoA thioester hydrolase|nr:acyl-CoA thioesterase [Candidatus Acetothermia bacterium]MCI2431364.1 acyl-CoA thioesterase [Candidatus Acetothermia bacterium]MCI2437454.1 acyl-CoA thioesterase [Candidatus Acetothermia bacterium]